MEHNISVLDKNGMYMSKCSQNRAKQMTGRKAAVWVDAHTIRVLYDAEDKRRFKETAMQRDNYTCYICGKVMYKGHPDVTADHIRARKKGGSDLPDNLACCCSKCNFEKGNMDLGTYLRMKKAERRSAGDNTIKTIGLSDRRPAIQRQ